MELESFHKRKECKSLLLVSSSSQNNQRKMKEIKAFPLLRTTKEKRKKSKETQSKYKETQQEEQRNPACKDKEIQQCMVGAVKVSTESQRQNLKIEEEEA